MYGWRARLGLVIPTNNIVIEPEFACLAPRGVSVHAARIQSGGLTGPALRKMVKNSDRAVAELTSGEMSLIVYACLATALVMGSDWTRAFCRRVAETTETPAIAASQATFDALQSLGVIRVALATPYPDRINDLLPPAFAEAGIEVVSLRNLKVENSLAVCRLEPSAAYAIARQADVDSAQAVCLLATDFRTIDVLEALERDLGKPVVSTNQALMWRAMTTLGIGARIAGYGSLLSFGDRHVHFAPTQPGGKAQDV